MSQQSVETWGWRNVADGTICQNVVAATPADLYMGAGLDVPEDPTLPRRGFQAVPVTVTERRRVKEFGRWVDRMTVVEVRAKGGRR